MRRPPQANPFLVDLSEHGASPLEAFPVLALASPEGSFHQAQGRRPPLAMYNLSVGSVADRVSQLAGLIEQFSKASSVDSLDESLVPKLTERMELALYAAAAHVDDVDGIAAGYFNPAKKKKDDLSYRALENAMDKHRRYVDLCANKIKHHQARINIISAGVSHGHMRFCMHGFFLEAVVDGVVVPQKDVHAKNPVFSLTSLVWEILVMVFQLSRILEAFLHSRVTIRVGPTVPQGRILAKAVKDAARLPLYTFGEAHPFDRASVRLLGEGSREILDSGLYGSIRHPWLPSTAPQPLRMINRYQGDGVTKSFHTVTPQRIGLTYWK